ncbi:MAG: hypothetical protein NHB32_24970 [Fischerella sp. CENA71]|nr:hypothetical protein [Fischerella sp. CENA71]
MKLLLITTLALIAGISSPALSVEVYKDFENTPYISSLKPEEILHITYENIPNKASFSTSDTCNVLIIKQLEGGKKFSTTGTMTIVSPVDYSNTASFSNTSLGGFSNEEYLNGKTICNGTNRNTSLKWTQISSGIYGLLGIRDGDYSHTFYIFGLNKGSYEVKDGRPAKRMMKANKCGILKITNSGKWPVSNLGNFYYYNSEGYPSDDYSLNSLQSRPADFCKNGILYKLVQ